MRLNRSLFICLLVLAILSSCSKAPETPLSEVSSEEVVYENPLDKLEKPSVLADQFAYVYGYQVSSSLLANFPDMNPDYLEKGVRDAINSSFIYTDAEANQILLDYQSEYQQKAIAELNEQGEKNLSAAESFLKTNALRSGVISISDKLQYEVLREGDSEAESPVADSTVVVQYQLLTLSGELKDSSYERGSASTLSLANTIEGFSEVVTMMKPGEKIRAWIHPDLGYGKYGNGTIGPSQLLIFDIELISVQ